MFTTRWQPFRLLGIPIFIDMSWLVILALLTLSLASVFPLLLKQYFPGVPDNLTSAEYWGLGLIAAVCFFGCILLHELGHALVARAQGTPIRGITLFLFGGVAEMAEEPDSARHEFLMAIAGPLVSIVLGVGLGILASVGHDSNWPHPLVIILGYLAFINLLLAAFNLVPAFPLDGGRVLRSILWFATGSLHTATHWASILGQLFAWLFIAWGVLQLFTGNWLGGIWMGLIGMFLNGAARASYQQVQVREALHGEPVRRFMHEETLTVPPSLDLHHWVDDFVYRYHRRMFPVAAGGHLEGVIETQALSRVARNEWDERTVADVMRSDFSDLVISPDAEADEALAKMQRAGSNYLLVTDGDNLLGTVSMADLLRFLELKMEMGDHRNGMGTAA